MPAFVTPVKAVKTPEDVKKWEKSEAYAVRTEKKKSSVSKE